MARKKKYYGKGRGRRDKKVLPQMTGKVQMTREGYIFVMAEGEEDDVFVKATRTNGALHGDIVRVAVTREKTATQRREGEVKEIIERSAKPFIGILHVVRGQAWVLMQSRFMPYDISVPYSFDLEQCSGMKVAAVVDFWKKGEPTPRGHIVDILGEPGENDTEMHAILAEYALPYIYPKRSLRKILREGAISGMSLHSPSTLLTRRILMMHCPSDFSITVIWRSVCISRM